MGLGQAGQPRHDPGGERGLEDKVGRLIGRDRHGRQRRLALRERHDVLGDVLERVAVLTELVLIHEDLRRLDQLDDPGLVAVGVERRVDPVLHGGRRDLERAGHLRVRDRAVVGGQDERPLALSDLRVQEADQVPQRLVLRDHHVLHLGAVHRPDVADVVDHLVVDEQEVGRVVLAEPLPLDHLLEDPGLVRDARRRVEPLQQRLDVVRAPLAVDLAVVGVHRANVVLEPRHVVDVLGEAVVGHEVRRQVPVEALGAERVRAELLPDHGDVLVAASPHGSVAEHPQMDAHGPALADARVVAHGAVVEVGERRLDQVRGALRPRRREVGADAEPVRDDPVRVGEGAGADRRVRLGGGGRARADGRVLVPRALRDQRLQVGPIVGPPAQDVAAARVPHHRDQQLRRCCVAGRRLDHRRAVDRPEGEAEQLSLRRRDPGERDRSLHDAGRRDVAGAVPEHRDVLRVRPRADVWKARGHVVRLDRQDLDLGAAVVAVASPGAEQPLVRHRTRERGRPALRVAGRPRCGGRAGGARRLRGGSLWGRGIGVAVGARDAHHDQDGEQREHTSGSHGSRIRNTTRPRTTTQGVRLVVVGGRRMLVLIVALAAIGIPAAVLTATCAGRSCANAEEGVVRVPFCPLPDAVKDGVVNGFREGRSPDVLGVADGTPIYTGSHDARASWPATVAATDTSVPVVFAGAGVTAGATIPAGVTLDRIAPTVSRILGFEREHPEVRSGTAVPDVADGTRPRLILLVAWRGVGAAELRNRRPAWPFLSALMRDGAGTLDGRTGSLPLDPAATETTIGTGGLPSQHGITGAFVRNDQGVVVPAFGSGSPVQVIATLADDLDETDPSTLVGLVAPDQSDRGLVGGGWYPDEDPVDTVIGDAAAAPLAVQAHLDTGYGADHVPDVLGVVLDGPVDRIDASTRRIVHEAQRSTSGSTLVVVAGTGSWEQDRLAVPDRELVDAVEDAVPGDADAVEATVPGGVFLDQTVLRDEQVTGQVAVDAMLSVTAPEGERMLADAFQGFAVSFARYC